MKAIRIEYGYRHSDIYFPEYPGGYGMVSKDLLETLLGIQVGTIGLYVVNEKRK